MFDELDDERPGPPAQDVFPVVLSRVRVLRRRRRVAFTAATATVTALVVATVLNLPRTDRDSSLLPVAPGPVSSSTAPPTAVPLPTNPPPPVVRPTPAATPSPTPRHPTGAGPRPTPTTTRTSGPPATAAPTTPPSVPAPTGPPSTAAAVIVLGGNDLGATRKGATRADALAAVSAVLGPPTADPADTVACVSAAREVAWGPFRLGFDGSGRVSGWVSRSTTLSTGNGVTVGSSVARLRAAYGTAVSVSAAGPDGEAGFEVQSEGVYGELSGTSPSDQVRSLRAGSCTGP